MLTPQEAEAHVFPKASFGGYNMLQVDTFLDSLIEDYRTLYQENISLKNKMKVLVDKVEEYRATEDAMRRALHSAQKMAEEMVREGEAKKKAAIEEAVVEVKRQSEATRAEMAKEEAAILARIEAVQTARADEEARLEAARTSTATYIGKLKELYTNELQYIGSLSELTAEKAAAAAVKAEAEDKAEAQPKEAPPEEPAPVTTPKATTPEVTVSAEQQEEVAQDIEASMARIFDTPAEEPAGDLGDTRVFDQIQFGKDYEIE